MTNLLDELKDLLKDEPRFFANGNILESPFFDAVFSEDTQLLNILKKSPRILKYFFVETSIKLDKVKLVKFVSNKGFLPDDYTQYRNKVGLANKQSGQYLSEINDTVLLWPHKDSVLVGGMTKGEKSQSEKFFNMSLNPDMISRLFEPKVLVNWGRWDSDAVKQKKPQKVKTISATDSLVIKGNNLMALHSIRKKYAGKVKLIYIDPPYNTGNDNFTYNDRYTKSTWLTFMKNRLEVARDFLTDDGALIVQCDDNMFAELKLLLDEVFPGGFVNCVAVKMSEACGVKMVHKESRLPKLKENLLIYRKSPSFSMNPQYVEKSKWDKNYNQVIEGVSRENLEIVKKYMSASQVSDSDVKIVNTILKDIKLTYINEFISKQNFTDREKFLRDNAWRIIGTASSESCKKIALKDQQNLPVLLRAIKTSNNLMYLYDTNFNKDSEQPKIKVMFADRYLKKACGDFWEDIKTTGIAQEGGVKLLNGKKPETLLMRIIELTTKPGDLVLDFFGGSGTTAAVAMKSGRQFITIEQLDDHIDLIQQRLKNVIGGDQTGVSKDYGWSGGGSYVYAELAKSNQYFLDRILAIANKNDLANVYDDLESEKVYLRYDVDFNKFDKNEFLNLPLDDAKQTLVECLDHNNLYVNLGSLGDQDFDVTEEDATITRDFYGVE